MSSISTFETIAFYFWTGNAPIIRLICLERSYIDITFEMKTAQNCTDFQIETIMSLCVLFSIFVFFALSLSKWILYNNFVHQCSAFPFPHVSKKVVFFSLKMNSNGNVVIAVIPTMLYAMSLLWCKRQNLFVVNKTRFHVYYSIDKLVIVVDNFM